MTDVLLAWPCEAPVPGPRRQGKPLTTDPPEAVPAPAPSSPSAASPPRKATPAATELCTQLPPGSELQKGAPLPTARHVQRRGSAPSKRRKGPQRTRSDIRDPLPAFSYQARFPDRGFRRAAGGPVSPAERSRAAGARDARAKRTEHGTQVAGLVRRLLPGIPFSKRLPCKAGSGLRSGPPASPPPRTRAETALRTLGHPRTPPTSLSTAARLQVHSGHLSFKRGLGRPARGGKPRPDARRARLPPPPGPARPAAPPAAAHPPRRGSPPG